MREDIKNAVDEIRKSLEESFGPGLAARIIFSARAAANAQIIGMTRDNYIDLVKAICSDNRVKEMWGEFGGQESNWVVDYRGEEF